MPAAAPDATVDLAQRPTERQGAVEAGAEHEPDGLAEEAPRDQEHARRDQEAARRAGSSATGSTMPGRNAAPTTSPRARPIHEVARARKPEPVAAHGSRRDDDDDESSSMSSVVHRAVSLESASRRAWVRKPVWATMRWSGRTDWPSTCQRALQHLDRLGHAERAVVERLAQLGDLHDGRGVGDEDPAGTQRRLGVLDHPPRLGQVEHDAVEVGLVDALVDVAHLDAVAATASSPRKAATFARARSAKSSRSS